MRNTLKRFYSLEVPFTPPINTIIVFAPGALVDAVRPLRVCFPMFSVCGI